MTATNTLPPPTSSSLYSRYITSDENDEFSKKNKRGNKFEQSRLTIAILSYKLSCMHNQ